MPSPVQKSLWQRIRRPFRWCRICLLSLALVLLGCFIFFDTVGLPSFVKTRLVAELQARGVTLDFSRLRLRWFRGLVAESVSLAGDEAGRTTRFSAREVALKPDWAALARFRFDVTALIVRDGRLEILLVSSNEPPVRLAVDRVETELRLLPDDRWELDRFDAESLGARVRLQGILTNASALARWRGAPATNQVGGAWQSYLRQAVEIASHLRFSQPPQMRLTVRGDAQDPASLSADASLDARDADTTWGRFEKLSLAAHFNRPSGSDAPGQSDLELVIDQTQTPWVQAAQSRVQVHWTQSPTNAMPSDVRWKWELDAVSTPWGTIPAARFTGRTTQSPEDPTRLNSELELDSGTLRSDWVDFETNRFHARIVHSPASLIPWEAGWQWTVTAPTSRWAQAQRFAISGQMTRSSTNAPTRANSDWAWWSLFEPYAVTWSARVDGVTLTNLPLDEVSLTGRWSAPDLAVDRVSARHAGRAADGSMTVNVETRRLEARFDSDFDLRSLIPSLPPTIRPWAESVQWTTPPRISAHAGLILPAWTNTHPNLLEVLPSLAVAGVLDSSEVRFGDLSALSVRSHFAYSNNTVQLPDLTVTRPEGSAEFDFTLTLPDERYQCRVRSGIDPLALRTLLKNTNSPVLGFFQFSQPPEIEGELWGRWAAPADSAFLARVRATNFVFRGERFDEVSASLQFTNRFLVVTDANVRSGTGTASGPGIGFNPASGMLFLTNAVAQIDPQLVLRCINPVLATNLSRYTFKQPPHAQVNGWIEVRQGRIADLRIDVSGGPFNYWKFNVPQISGTILLLNEHVAITNLAADFYGGRLSGDIAISSTTTPSPDIRFALQSTGTDLNLLMGDISSPTNRLEGILNAELTITRANAADWGSWNGYGNVRMRDGYLWDIPLFGIFSPVLNAIVPGLGQSRASAGVASFFITNSVIHTRDLEIRSPAMRLAYRGTIDFDYRVDARVEARLLHDMWVVGPIVSLVFSPLTKLLEYKVTGTLNSPKLEPLLIPKPLQFPLHPWRTLKDLFSNEKPEKPPEAPQPSPVPQPPP